MVHQYKTIDNMSEMVGEKKMRLVIGTVVETKINLLPVKLKSIHFIISHTSYNIHTYMFVRKRKVDSYTC